MRIHIPAYGYIFSPRALLSPSAALAIMIRGMVVGAFVLVALAVARFTLMVTSDRIMLPFRRWVVNTLGEESIWSYYAHCSRCVSVWVALPGAVLWGTLTLPLHQWWLIAPAWFALSYLTVLMSRLEEKD